MIGRQLDLFGGPPKPPKNIVIEDEPEVQEPETVAPEAPAPLTTSPVVEENPSPESSEAGMGIHVQMPSPEIEEPSSFPDDTTLLAEEDEGLNLNESAGDFSLEEAIAAELVSVDYGSSENPAPETEVWEANPAGVPAEEVMTLEEPITDVAAVEWQEMEAPAVEDVTPEEPIVEEYTAVEPELEVPEVEAATGQEPVEGVLEEEPDWISGNLPVHEPELAAEPAFNSLPESSLIDEDSTTVSGVVEQTPEITEEDWGATKETEDNDGNEAAGPLNIPSDQALYSRQYYTMRETANMFNVNQSLLRFWENEFDILKPKKNRKGDRYFRPDDIKNLELIYHLLRVRKFTISGAKDYLKNKAKSLDTFVMVQRLEKLKLFLQELKTNA